MTFLKLNEYLSDARKIMAAQKCGYLIDDEDAVAYVAYRMMVADQSYNGTSSPSTWRYNQAKYAIMRLIDKRKKHNSRKILSLDHGWLEKENDEDGAYLPLAERISSNNARHITHHEEVYNQFEIVCDHAGRLLSDKQYYCFLGYYKDHKTLQSIGDEIGVSRERVRQHLEAGKGILKRCLSKLDL